MNKAIFLDKDGTLIPDIPYNVDTARISLSPECIEGLKLFIADGYKLIVISNQSGIARGYFSEEQFEPVISRLAQMLEDHGIILTNFYYCPHHPEGTKSEYAINCNCRKPMPGMLLEAAKDHQLDLAQCWMIGDILNDVEAGNRAGCRTILIDNGNETEWVEGNFRTPAFISQTINAAATFIHNQSLINVRLEQC
jgi:D-glycero-D-manno-heptose 1,7-bisphosphate phosphatase